MRWWGQALRSSRAALDRGHQLSLPPRLPPAQTLPRGYSALDSKPGHTSNGGEGWLDEAGLPRAEAPRQRLIHLHLGQRAACRVLS